MGYKTSCAKGPTDKALLDITIGEAFAETARHFPESIGLVVAHQQVRWTYSRYLEEVDNLARGLLALGVRPGDRVGIWSPNCAEWSLAQFATARIGAILVCINPAYRVFELEYALNLVDCNALITADRFKSSDYIGMLLELAPELEYCEPGNLRAERLPALQTIIRIGPDGSPGMLNFNDVCSLGKRVPMSELDIIASRLRPDDAINIQFTSGTTGNPKGATLTHHNILNNGFIVGEGMRLTPSDRLCIPVPLYHCFGMVMGNLACITHGSTAVFPSESFDPESTLQAVQDEKCTALHGVPTMFIAELDHPNFDRFDLTSLRTGIMAGAPCPVELMNRLIGQMNLSEILIAYGQTETSPVNHMTEATDPIEKRVGSVGRPAPHCEIKIIDSAGNIVPRGETGEICCRGYAVMRGYWNEPERTAETVDQDGWLHSGDLGVMDEHGYSSITGRIKDMIIRGGENIYPREIEEFLYTHPDIVEVQVFGVPDTRYGEQICSWIRRRNGSELCETDIEQFCNGQIAHFKIPHHIRFVEEFPMTVTGKMQKFVMRELMEKELAAK